MCSGKKISLNSQKQTATIMANRSCSLSFSRKHVPAHVLIHRKEKEQAPGNMFNPFRCRGLPQQWFPSWKCFSSVLVGVSSCPRRLWRHYYQELIQTASESWHPFLGAFYTWVWSMKGAHHTRKHQQLILFQSPCSRPGLTIGSPSCLVLSPQALTLLFYCLGSLSIAAITNNHTLHGLKQIYHFTVWDLSLTGLNSGCWQGCVASCRM